MGLLVNPQKEIVKVPVSKDLYICFEIKPPSNDDIISYRKTVGKIEQKRNKFNFSDKTTEERIRLMTKLGINAWAENEQGEKMALDYIDPGDGQRKELTPEVTNWFSYIDTRWIISAGAIFEGFMVEESGLDQDGDPGPLAS